MPWADIVAFSVEPGGNEGRTRYLWGCQIATHAWALEVDEWGVAGRQIARVVGEQTLAPAWHRLREALHEGRELQLGCLAIGPQGMRIGRKGIGWRGIASIELEDREVVIRGIDPYVDGELRSLQYLIGFEPVLLELERMSFGYRLGQVDELVLGDPPAVPPPCAEPAALPTAAIRQ